MKIKKWLISIAVVFALAVALAWAVVKLNVLSAEDGSAAAQCNAGVFYENGWFLFKSDEKAIYWYGKSAAQGYPMCQYNLARMLAKKNEYSSAFSWFLKAAKQNHPMSQYALGRMYSDGQGVPRDVKIAAYWMKKAAEQDITQAQLFLATMYAKGEGVPFDLDQAASLAARAAKLGDSDAVELVELLKSNRTELNKTVGREAK